MLSVNEMTMSSKDKLHELIHALTPSEKRYFKVYISHNEVGDKGNYRLLFEAVSKLKTYDETQLKARLTGTTVGRNLSVTKHYLYGHILKSLELYHHRADVDKQLYSLKSQIQILQSHGLFSQSSGLIGKALLLAKEHEKFMDVAELALWQLMAMTREYELRDLENKLEAVYRTVTEALNEFQQHSILSYLDTKALLLIKKYGIVRDELQLKMFEQLVDDPSMSDGRQHSFLHLYYYHHILSLYHFALENEQENYLHRKELVELFGRHPERKSTHQDLYITALNNLVLICNQLGMVDEFNKWLRILESLEATSTSNQIKAFTNVNTMRLMDAFGRNDFEDIIDRTPGILDGLKQFGNKVDLSNRMLFRYVIAASHLAAGRYDASLLHFHALLKIPQCEEIQDLYRFTRLLLLVVHFKLENDRILEAQMQSLQRYLRSKKKLYRGESLLLELLRSLRRNPDTEKQVEAYNNFLSCYEELQKDTFERRVNSYFPFQMWASKEMNNLTRF